VQEIEAAVAEAAAGNQTDLPSNKHPDSSCCRNGHAAGLSVRAWGSENVTMIDDLRRVGVHGATID
jgi:glycerophosphoryl diester phosphodiesterase